jgi:hypothetical protein
MFVLFVEKKKCILNNNVYVIWNSLSLYSICISITYFVLIVLIQLYTLYAKLIFERR